MGPLSFFGVFLSRRSLPACDAILADVVGSFFFFAMPQCPSNKKSRPDHNMPDRDANPGKDPRR